ncbi:hypothetical protein Mapa_009300 [Marchantia paleacea]|nr:hypothetical protein Mapa_009300 [Marchantia paleacea]
MLYFLLPHSHSPSSLPCPTVSMVAANTGSRPVTLCNEDPGSPFPSPTCQFFRAAISRASAAFNKKDLIPATAAALCTYVPELLRQARNTTEDKFSCMSEMASWMRVGAIALGISSMRLSASRTSWLNVCSGEFPCREKRRCC